MNTALILGFVLIFVVLFVILPIFVYKDAQRLNMENPSKWAAIILVTGGTGLLLYLFERDDAKHETGDEGPFTLPGSSNTDTTSSEHSAGKRD